MVVNRSICWQMFFKKGAQKMSQISQENTRVRVLFFKKRILKSAALLRLQQRCFPVKFEKFLKTPFLTEHL